MKNDKTAKTYIEKLGFKDDDLYEKNHDELMQFLVNNKKFIAKYIGTQTGLYPVNPSEIKLELEYCLKNGIYVNGFVDAYLTYNFRCREVKFPIEIKTKINSFGAVLRELNYYQSILNNTNWIILFSNDDKYRKLFKEQNILFVTEKDINNLKINNLEIVKYANEKDIILCEDVLFGVLRIDNYKKIIDKLSDDNVWNPTEEDIFKINYNL